LEPRGPPGGDGATSSDSIIRGVVERIAMEISSQKSAAARGGVSLRLRLTIAIVGVVVIAEAGAPGNALGSSGLAGLLGAGPHNSLAEQADAVLREASARRHGGVQDDMTLLAMECTD